MTAQPWTIEAFRAHRANQQSEDKKVYVYHAHIYFDETDSEALQSTKDFKEKIQEEFGHSSHTQIRPMVEKPSGPHPCGQFEFAFTRDIVPDVLPWLQLYRPPSLSILLHPFTHRVLDDHVEFATWMGKPLDLRLEVLVGIQKTLIKLDEAGEEQQLTALMWRIICD